MMFKDYSRPLLSSFSLHLGLLFLMFWHPESHQAVLESEQRSKIAEQAARPSEPAPIQAVAVDSAEVQAAMQKIQQQKEQAKRQEQQRQKQLAEAAKRAQEAKVAEMKRVEELKQQAIALKLQQEKMKQQAAENLKKLEQQKKQQEKQLADMKKKQIEENLRLEKIAKQRDAEQKAQAAAIAKAESEKQAQVVAAKQAEALANQQRMAGEVDRYKALILNAIRDRWILPENVDPSLSSQFLIRLAPTGAVLDVVLVRSSGDTLLDRSAQAAIIKASPMPVPTDAAVFNNFRQITLTVRPSNARG